MAAEDFRVLFRELAERFLSHQLTEADGFPEHELVTAEARLHLRIPPALRGYYSCAGRFSPFSSIHNLLRQPDAIAVEDCYLVYMDENQNVVTWGIQMADLAQPNPVVWQRNNTPPTEWFSEEKPFTDLMLSMFLWYAETGIWNK